MNCVNCKWWTDEGCYNSNWIGSKTDPSKPVCDGISYSVIKIINGEVCHG